MVQRRELRIPSSDGRSGLHVVCWIPEGGVRAVFQISHGMIEYIMRYNEFAGFLAENGIAVVGHDHLGHGDTVQDNRYGHFAERDGHICVIKDLHRVTRWMKSHFPDKPYYMMGHSMGSFFLRRYLTLYGRELSGAIIMGTGDQALPVVVAGKLMASLIGLIKGREYPSAWMHELALGSYSRAFAPSRTKNDWLSKEEDMVDRYCADPYCSFRFTCAAYRDFFNIMIDLKLGRQSSLIPKSLPLFILSGAEDPVGEFGKGVRRVYYRYIKSGMKDVEMILYPDDRHELLNETDRHDVYHDILNWILYHEAEA